MTGRNSGQDATGDRQPWRKVCAGLAYYPLPQAACPGNRSVMASPTHALERRSRKGSHWTVRPREGAVDISRACGFVAKGKDSWESVPAVTQHTTQTSPFPHPSRGQGRAEGPSSPHGRGVQTNQTHFPRQQQRGGLRPGKGMTVCS